MKGKKFLLILFVALYVLFALTGCHKVSPATTKPPGNSIPEEFSSQVNRSEDVASVPPADPLSAEEGIMPLMQIYPETSIAGEGSYRTTDFAATPSNGKYIRIWYQNNSDEKARVYLYLKGFLSNTLVASMSVEAGELNMDTYNSSNADKETYYVHMDAPETGGTIKGSLAVAQYDYDPN